MNLRTTGGSSAVGSLGHSWGILSGGRVPSLLQTMVPAGYSALQEERLVMSELNGGGGSVGSSSAKPDLVLGNSYHRENRAHRHLDRTPRSPLSAGDLGDGRFSETQPMLPNGELSGEEDGEDVGDEEEEEDDDEEEVEMERPPMGRNMPKESPLAMALQIVVPFLLAGFGTVSAGMVLDVVQVS